MFVLLYDFAVDPEMVSMDFAAWRWGGGLKLLLWYSLPPIVNSFPSYPVLR